MVLSLPAVSCLLQLWLRTKMMIPQKGVKSQRNLSQMIYSIMRFVVFWILRKKKAGGFKGERQPPLYSIKTISYVSLEVFTMHRLSWFVIYKVPLTATIERHLLVAALFNYVIVWQWLRLKNFWNFKWRPTWNEIHQYEKIKHVIGWSPRKW